MILFFLAFGLICGWWQYKICLSGHASVLNHAAFCASMMVVLGCAVVMVGN